jgi:hypothetical protein
MTSTPLEPTPEPAPDELGIDTDEDGQIIATPDPVEDA